MMLRRRYCLFRLFFDADVSPSASALLHACHAVFSLRAIMMLMRGVRRSRGSARVARYFFISISRRMPCFTLMPAIR